MPPPPDPCLSQFSDSSTGGRHFCRGTAVVLQGKGVLMLGPSGSGKSRTALEMMAQGARLLADDGLWIDADNNLHRPSEAPALIELRGIGLLRADMSDAAVLALIVDLSRSEPDRLPPRRLAAAPGGPVPLILGRGHPFLAPALCHYLIHGREA